MMGNDVQRVRTEEERMAIAARICEMYATDQFSIKQCLKSQGIKSRTTWFNWCNTNPIIKKMYDDSIALKDQVYKHGVKERAQKMLEKFISGYTKKVTEIKFEDMGNGTRRIIEQKEKEVYVKPSAGALMYVLNNLDGGNFQRNPEPETGGNDVTNIPPRVWVDHDDDIEDLE